MINRNTRHLPCCRPLRGRGRAGTARLATTLGCLGLLAGLGCYRATGFQRNPMTAEVIPAAFGDRVLGIKSKAGQGDYYLGNDFVHVAIDSNIYGDALQAPLAGAASGGSIVDAGYLQLDPSYNRVSTPSSAMHRLTPVVNQDPAMQVVFDQYALGGTNSQASLTMTGRLLDPSDRLGTGTSPVAGVAVSHTLTIAQLDRFFTVTTVVTNNTAGTLPIRSVGDCLVQQGGGYAFNVPANFDSQGNALATRWGVQIPATTDFTYATGTPVSTSVQAAMVGLMATEPGADTVDSHCGVGILPLDADRLLVASDPQDLLLGGVASMPNRPVFPARLVAGSLPVTGLAPGASLTFHRRLYLLGGSSVATGLVGGLSISADYANTANGLFNLMDLARYVDTSVRPAQDTGVLTFTLSGNAQRQGPLPTEVRIERNVALAGSGAATWQVQRVEWFEPNENLVSRTGLATSTLQVKLPVGTYRMVLTSLVDGQKVTQTRTLFHNLNQYDDVNSQNQVGLAQALVIEKDREFKVDPQDILCPGASTDPNATGVITSNTYSQHYFLTAEANGPTGSMQPLRLTFLNADGTAAPAMRRLRTLGSRWGAAENEPVVASGAIPGQYQFRGGNEMFGTAFTRVLPAMFAWFRNGSSYQVYGTRGPLSELTPLSTGSTFKAFDGQTDVNHSLIVTPRGLPPGWTSFDLPGPGQATTGGTLPVEKLASGLANGIQVVGDTEQDRLVDTARLYYVFRLEYTFDTLIDYEKPASLSAIDRPVDMPYGLDPFVVGGRTSTLPGFGTVSSLFTTAPTSAPPGRRRRQLPVDPGRLPVPGPGPVHSGASAPGPPARRRRQRPGQRPGLHPGGPVHPSRGPRLRQHRSRPVVEPDRAAGVRQTQRRLRRHRAAARRGPGPGRPGPVVQRVQAGAGGLVRHARRPVPHLVHQGPGPVLGQVHPGHPRGPGPYLPEGPARLPGRPVRGARRPPGRRRGGLHRPVPGRERGRPGPRRVRARAGRHRHPGHQPLAHRLDAGERDPGGGERPRGPDPRPGHRPGPVRDRPPALHRHRGRAHAHHRQGRLDRGGGRRAPDHRHHGAVRADLDPLECHNEGHLPDCRHQPDLHRRDRDDQGRLPGSRAVTHERMASRTSS